MHRGKVDPGVSELPRGNELSRDHVNRPLGPVHMNPGQGNDIPFRQSCPGQKTISYLGPNIWNNLAAETKLRRSVNSFKHDIKKLFFDKLKKQNDDIFFYY